MLFRKKLKGKKHIIIFHHVKKEVDYKELSFQDYINKYIVDNIYQAHENFE